MISFLGDEKRNSLALRLPAWRPLKKQESFALFAHKMIVPVIRSNIRTLVHRKKRPKFFENDHLLNGRIVNFGNDARTILISKIKLLRVITF